MLTPLLSIILREEQLPQAIPYWYKPNPTIINK
jgi:hypothetical protein